MMGAICFIPKFSQQKNYLEEDQISSSNTELPYYDIFDQSVLEKTQKELAREFHNLFCQVHKIN